MLCKENTLKLEPFTLNSKSRCEATMLAVLPDAAICCPMPLKCTAKVVTVSAGYRHTAFLLATGEMLTAGEGLHGRILHGVGFGPPHNNAIGNNEAHKYGELFGGLKHKRL